MLHRNFESCIKACKNAFIECIHCESSCMREEKVKDLLLCIQLNRDCAEICALTAKALASDSLFAKQFCKLCAEICQACADECNKHAHMAHCKRCAEVCYSCAEECRQMI